MPTPLRCIAIHQLIVGGAVLLLLLRRYVVGHYRWCLVPDAGVAEVGRDVAVPHLVRLAVMEKNKSKS